MIVIELVKMVVINDVTSDLSYSYKYRKNAKCLC